MVLLWRLGWLAHSRNEPWPWPRSKRGRELQRLLLRLSLLLPWWLRHCRRGLLPCQRHHWGPGMRQRLLQLLLHVLLWVLLLRPVLSLRWLLGLQRQLHPRRRRRLGRLLLRARMQAIRRRPHQRLGAGSGQRHRGRPILLRWVGGGGIG